MHYLAATDLVLVTSELCSVDELKSRLSEDDVKVVDASWYLPAANINCIDQFSKQRIAGAVFFDIDEVCDQTSDLPHMLPTEDHFAQAVLDLGIDNQSDVVVYDTAGLFSAARVWWMFKIFGHERVRVLDGGLPAWLNAGGETESGPSKSASRAKAFKAQINETFLADKSVIKKNIDSGDYIVLDARSKGRFNGEEPEPRIGLSSGHMPRSKSLPIGELIKHGKLKTVGELINVFSKLGLQSDDHDQALITSCGSGVTAAIITLALVQCGFGMHKLYDGAWAEWASAEDSIILGGHESN